MWKWLDRISDFLERRLSLFFMLGGASVVGLVTAGAARATDWLNHYGPIAWVSAGLLGALCTIIVIAIASWARLRWIRAHYNARLIKRSGFVDPLAATFHGKRIYWADFIEPANSFIEGKTFIDCELIGPVVIYLESGNQLSLSRFPVSDAVILETDRKPYNGVLARNCLFRGCSFVRTTFILHGHDFENFKHLPTLNWISKTPANVEQIDLSGRPDLKHSALERAIENGDEEKPEGSD